MCMPITCGNTLSNPKLFRDINKTNITNTINFSEHVNNFNRTIIDNERKYTNITNENTRNRECCIGLPTIGGILMGAGWGHQAAVLSGGSGQQIAVGIVIGSIMGGILGCAFTYNCNRNREKCEIL